MNQQIHSILVPLDTSALSEEILTPTAALAWAMGHGLTVLHIVPPTESLLPIGEPALTKPDLRTQWVADKMVRARIYLASVVLRLEAVGVSARAEVAVGVDVPQAIVETATRDNAEMIAMTTHGFSGFRHWALGSVAEAVLHAAPVPLLLLRARYVTAPFTSPGQIRSILVALDGSSFAEQTLRLARTIGSALCAKLVLVHVVEPGAGSRDAAEMEQEFVRPKPTAAQHYLDRIAERLRKDGYDVGTHIAVGHPAAQILNVAQRERVDLIVLATHGRGGFQRLMLGSIAQQVARQAEHAVLLVRVREA